MSAEQQVLRFLKARRRLLLSDHRDNTTHLRPLDTETGDRWEEDVVTVSWNGVTGVGPYTRLVVHTDFPGSRTFRTKALLNHLDKGMGLFTSPKLRDYYEWGVDIVATRDFDPSPVVRVAPVVGHDPVRPEMSMVSVSWETGEATALDGTRLFICPPSRTPPTQAQGDFRLCRPVVQFMATMGGVGIRDGALHKAVVDDVETRLVSFWKGEVQFLVESLNPGTEFPYGQVQRILDQNTSELPEKLVIASEFGKWVDEQPVHLRLPDGHKPYDSARSPLMKRSDLQEVMRLMGRQGVLQIRCAHAYAPVFIEHGNGRKAVVMPLAG